jgi:hypothetical protein
MDPIEVRERIKKSIEEIADGFEKHDDDFVPFFFIYADKYGLQPLQVPPGLMGGDRGKDALSVAMAQMVSATKAETAAFVSSVWMVHQSKEKAAATEEQRQAFIKEHGREPQTYEELGVSQPKYDPEHIEAVILSVMTAKGCVSFSTAQIYRHDDDPPHLGEWDESPAQKFTGRFVTPVVEALRKVKEQHAGEDQAISRD